MSSYKIPIKDYFFFRWLTKPGIPVELQTLSLGSLQLLMHVDDNIISQGIHTSANSLVLSGSLPDTAPISRSPMQVTISPG